MPIFKLGAVLLSFLLIYGIGLMPISLSIFFTYQLLGNTLLFFLVFPFLLVIGFYSFILTVIGLIAIFVRVFRLKYKEGTYKLSLKDPQAFRYVMYGSFYHSINWLVTELHAYQIKEWLAKAGGAKIGKGVVLGGYITDPSLFEVGDGTIIGGRCEILSHVGEKGKLYFKKVKIGKGCLVGQGATILAGVTMEDGSVLGANSLATKNMVLEKGKFYGGVPAREIRRKKK